MLQLEFRVKRLQQCQMVRKIVVCFHCKLHASHKTHSIDLFFSLFFLPLSNTQSAFNGQMVSNHETKSFVKCSDEICGFILAAAALRGVAIQTSRARAAFPARTFARMPTPMTNAAAANTLHGYAP